MRTLTYFVGVTLDGYIAAPDGSFDFFPVEPPVVEFIAEHYPETMPTFVRDQLGLTAPGTRFDTVVMGRGTYTPGLDAGITSPYAHLQQHVVSTTLPDDTDKEVTFTNDDPVALVRRLKQEPGLGVWLAGGGHLAAAVLEEIDELVLKRYPIVLGAGIPVLAGSEAKPLPFTPTERRDIPGGTTVTTYVRRTA